MAVETGLEVLLRDPEVYLGGDRVGVITNPTGVTRDLSSLVAVFHRHTDIHLEAVFGPEHGAGGDAQDALSIDHDVDPATGLPAYSLYGETTKPTREMLEGLDHLVFDIQDVGARFYTYSSTLTYALEAAAENYVRFTVLDRPNPINGRDVEGCILERGQESFVGLHPVPIRHGLTLGELALLINEEAGADLRVVPMEGWTRDMWIEETGLPWVQPSPNIPTPETATVYPGTCLFEGTTASEGRGITRPFEYVGAPWLDGHRWAGELNALGLPGARFRACRFTPAYGRYHGLQCGGVQLHVTDRNRFRPVKTALHMMSTARRMWPDEFRWLPPSYDARPHFDLLAGTDRLRRDMEAARPVDEIIAEWSGGLERFMESRRRHLLYGEE